MSIIPPPDQPNPERVRFEDIRVGDFIRVRYDSSNKTLLQFVVKERASSHVSGHFGGVSLAITEDDAEFFMLEAGPRIPETYTFGWLGIGKDTYYSTLGYWRTNLAQNLVEGFVIRDHGLEERKHSLDEVGAFAPAYVSSRPTATNMTTTNALSTSTCTCSGKGPCWGCR